MLSIPPSQFHWVQKGVHSHSLSNTNNEEQRQIRRFVQQKRLQTRRYGALQIRFSKESSTSSVPNSADLPSRSHRAISEPESKDETLLRSPESKPDRSRRSNRSVSDNPSRTAKASIRRVRAPQWQKLTLRKSSPGVPNTSELAEMQETWCLNTINFLEGSAVDPFSVTTRPMTNEVANLFSYWSSVITSGGNAYKLQALPDRVKDVIPVYAVRDEYLSNALRYAHCLYAISSFVSSRLQYVNKLQLKGLQNPAHYMAKSIGLIRRRLEECVKSDSKVDNPTISAIALIALADWTSGDLHAARIHLKTLSRLIDLIDSKSPTGRYMIESIRTADFQVAVEGHTKPMLCALPSFEPLSRERITELEREIQIAIQKGSIQDEGVASHLGYDLPPPDDILSDLARTLDLRLGWALEKILGTNTIASALHPMIRNMLDVLTIMKAVWRLETAEVKDARYMCRWGRTQGHFLFTYGYDHADDDPTPQVLLTDCVRLALLVVLTLSTNRMGRRAAQRIGYELFEACQRYKFEVSASDVLAGKAHLWALVTAAIVAEDDTVVKYWLLQQAASIAVRLGLTSYEDLHEAMTGFLYSRSYSLQTMRDVLSIIELGGMAEW